MAVAQVSSTTLSAAITATQSNNIAVASASGISAGNLIVIRQEAMKVISVDTTANTVNVVRGYAGSQAWAQPNGARAYYASPNTWDFLREVAGSKLGLTGASGSFPNYLLPGQRAVDGAGNEYILVDLTATCYSGTTVLISNDGVYTAAPLVGGNQGAVGLTIEEGSSNQFTWAQIYGYNSYAQDSTATSAASSTYVPVAATSVSTPDVGMAAISPTTTDQYLINGMFIVGAATSSTTSATSSTGIAVPVFLNYPYSIAWKVNVIAPTS